MNIAQMQELKSLRAVVAEHEQQIAALTLLIAQLQADMKPKRGRPRKEANA